MNEEYLEEAQEFANVAVEAFQDLPSHEQKLVKYDTVERSVFQKGFIYKAAILAMIDFILQQQDYDNRMSVVPGAILQTPLIKRLKRHVRLGKEFLKHNWASIEISEKDAKHYDAMYIESSISTADFMRAMGLDAEGACEDTSPYWDLEPSAWWNAVKEEVNGLWI
jgi:hypothetical protein